MVNIHHRLLIGATAETVFRAISTSEGLSAWWTPNSTAIAAVGEIASMPFGNGYVKKMEIQTLVPYSFLKWQCIEGDVEWIGTTITFSLIQRGEEELLDAYPEVAGQAEQSLSDSKTLLIFEHNGWKDYSRSFGECSYTWAQFLRSLRRLCEIGKGLPWPMQHRIQ